MRHLLSFTLLFAFNVGCGKSTDRAHTVAFDPTPVYYEAFTAGDAITDQSVGAPGSFSTLIGTTTDDANVSDTDFTSHVASRARSAGASLYFVFNQCYGGGFLDNLQQLGGTQSVMTAARHSETASYATEPPGGVDLDSTDTFIRAMGDGRVPAETVARVAVALNPFGPNPDANRINEPVGSEHAQYMAIGKGAELEVADYARTGMAVLWAGQPAERDGIQMNLMIDRLVAMGYPRSSIWLLYAGGEADGEHPFVRSHMKSKDDSIHLLAATKENLFDLFARTFEAESLGRGPEFVFLYVGDHGGLDGTEMAKSNFGGADSLVTPILEKEDGRPLYGEGHHAFH